MQGWKTTYELSSTSKEEVENNASQIATLLKSPETRTARMSRQNVIYQDLASEECLKKIALHTGDKVLCFDLAILRQTIYTGHFLT